MSAVAPGDDLLFLHGAGGRGLTWQPQLLAFPRAHAPDLPGPAGGAPGAANGYLAALRVHVGAGAPRRVVAGHSLGGAIALLWALRHPDEVRALILIGTGARLSVPPDLLEALRAGGDQGLEALISAWFSPQADGRVKEKSLALLRAGSRDALLTQLDAAGRFDVTDEVEGLRLPALIICGAEDQVTPLESSLDLHRRIGGSELVVVGGGGHMVMLEQPRVVNAAMRGFLDRLQEEQR